MGVFVVRGLCEAETHTNVEQRSFVRCKSLPLSFPLLLLVVCGQTKHVKLQSLRLLRFEGLSQNYSGTRKLCTVVDYVHEQNNKQAFIHFRPH